MEGEVKAFSGVKTIQETPTQLDADIELKKETQDKKDKSKTKKINQKIKRTSK